MKKVNKETLKNELGQMIIDCFVNITTVSDICNEIRKHINVSNEQEKCIGLILDKYKTKWRAKPFKIKTVTKKQINVLDKISDDCIEEIINILN